MHIKEKVAPSKFKGSIGHIPLHAVADYITFTCILSVEKGDDIGSLFFKKGKLVDAELNKNFHISKAKEILSWTDGSFSYQKWGNEFELEYKHLSNILHFIEISNLNSELSFIFEDKPIKIVCSDGAIVGIEPQPKDLNIFFIDILKENKGNVKIRCNGGQTGDLKEYFSDVMSSKKKIGKEKLNNKKAPDSASKKELPKGDNNNIKIIKESGFEQSFIHLQNDLGDVFLAGSIYNSKTGEAIYTYKTETDQSVLFSQLHNNVNSMLTQADFGKINNYYLLDLEENYLLFILTFKDHHFGLAFDKSKVKLGYLFGIVKPILTDDYNNMLNIK